MLKPHWILLALLPLAACNANRTDPFAATVPHAAPTVASTSLQDQSFAVQAAQSDMAAIAAGRIALQRSRSTPVRRFAQQMVTEHSASLQALRDLAPQKGITLPGEPDGPSQEMLATLQGATGPRLNRLYMESQIAAHESAAALMRTQIESGTDPDLKNLAQARLAAIERHLAMARALRS